MEGAGHALWFLSIPLMIFFILLLSIPNLIFSTYDFIIVAKSSPLAGFIISIIGTVLFIIETHKPSDDDHQDGVDDIGAKYEENDYYDDHVSDVEDVEVYHGYDGYEEENDDDLDTDDDLDSSEEDEQDNDLERRAEEFIAKVTRKWREELLTENLLCIKAT